MARDEAYREAEEKIEEARRTGAAELDLSHAQLTALPESLSQLTQLRALNLSSNQLTALPKRLLKLTQLQDLNISTNQLTALPYWLDTLMQLRSLNVSRNQLITLPGWLGQLKQLQVLNLHGNELTELPYWLGNLRELRSFDVSSNQLITLPESLAQFRQLEYLEVWGNLLRVLPECIFSLKQLVSLSVSRNELIALPSQMGELSNLRELYAIHNMIEELPDEICNLSELRRLVLGGNELGRSGWRTTLTKGNRITDLPACILQLNHIEHLALDNNPLNPELAAAYEEGLDAVKRYLRAKSGAQIVLNEAKLILVGEGEVGKSCLLGALRGDEWEEGRPTTHGIEIKPAKVKDPDSGTEITLNGWDFGGQRVYRPTHQLFFSAPAVYLVVWKPREGPEQGFVKDWIRLVKHREPEAKILVVATHGGPGARQPDISPQEYWELFGHDTLINFFHIDSKPDKKTGEREGIAELKDAIARVAASLPEMGRKVPARWQQAREALQKTDVAYLPLEQVLEICREHKMEEDEARLFVSISHRLGHLIHYAHDPTLRDIVVLKPDWLATAISLVLDDKQTRDRHGLVDFAHLSQLWNDSERDAEFRYDLSLHPVFLRLMERFDLSYKVALPSDVADEVGFWQRVRSAFDKSSKHRADTDQLRYTSLIAQLVPDIRPEQDLTRMWPPDLTDGDEQQVQICRIVDAKTGQSAAAEGLFYQLIVRLHKFSLGRVNYEESIHWQRGLVLDYEYNGQALLEHIGNDVRITVRAPSPVTFLSILTHEVKWLVENFWEGLRCEVVVPCVEPCGMNEPGRGAFEVQKLIAFKRQGMTAFPCFVSGCDQAQNIDCLLQNAPAAQRTSVEQLVAQGFDRMRSRLDGVRAQLNQQDRDAEERFRVLDLNDRRIMSQVEDAFRGLMQALTDEAKEGPRLFSFQPVEPGFFDRPKWMSQKFQLTLWCEHSRQPLSALNGEKDGRGVYELTLPRDWFIKAAPFLKVLTTTLSLVLPVAASATKLVMSDASYKAIEKELDLGQKSIESVLKGGEAVGSWLGRSDAPGLEHGEAIRAQGAVLRELHALLKKQDPSFGGLIRVQNKRQEFLWVHPQFEKEY
jgi:Leucine-rich repeat (LRR) protein